MGLDAFYSQKYVIFLDVLGWSDLVARSETDEDARRQVALVSGKLAKAFEEAQQNVEKSENHPATPRFEFFSDSMIITIPFLGDNVFWPEEAVFRTCENLARATMEEGLLIRGAVTRGSIAHDADKRICVGPALLRAYSLETKTAIYPRIVIDPNLVNYFEEHYKTMKEDAEKHLPGCSIAKPFREMDDRIPFIDYLAPRFLDKQSGKVHKNEVETFKVRTKMAQTLGRQNAKTFKDAGQVKQKYDWFTTYSTEVMLRYFGRNLGK